VGQIKNLLFDLGGVLYEVDYKRTEQAFYQLYKTTGTQPVQYNQLQQDSIFDRFEEGKLDAQNFRTSLRKNYNLSVTDIEIDAAWNAMLIGVIEGRKELLKKLGIRFPLALLSNTNFIHWERVGKESKELLEEFEYVFLSCEIGLRKPNRDVFEYVLKKTEFLANETLFIDDSPQHIATASELGIQTLHLVDWKALEVSMENLLSKQ